VRVSRLEWSAAVVAVVVLTVLVVLEPDIVDAPFASTRALLFTAGGTVLAAVALVLMVRLRVHPGARLVVLGVPFVAVQWWLISPFFFDDVVHDAFETSIAEQQAADEPPGADAPAPPPPAERGPTPSTSSPPSSEAPPQLLGAGQVAGLAGHEGTGDAGIFRLADGRQVLRFEHLDIENGPDLELYLVPGRDRTSPGDGAIHLGPLRGNVGNLTYELPGDGVAPGDWTVLVWCEAFTVEFVAASLTLV
jgi:hypothetical protein